jgi:hypothetical protein
LKTREEIRNSKKRESGRFLIVRTLMHVFEDPLSTIVKLLGGGDEESLHLLF